MTIRLQEVVRSEVEGGLSGPANPIPNQSIDCGCGQMQCPKLAKFATRKLYVGLICWVGIVQAASYAYFYVTGSTIARKFQIDPYLMDWILTVTGLTPFFLGLPVAYWGDKIHRASWTGALTLLQSASYFILVVPHLTHRVRVETQNVTHMSLYADDSPELCTLGVSRMIVEDEEPCYFTMFVLIVVLAISGIANIAYYALGISYLDDNTKKRHVTAFVGLIVAVKVIGVLLGYLLGWGCLRIDAEDLTAVKSYRDQIGAWWLGFPILAIFLVVPGLLLSWFPRRLPSEVVEQAAASLLDRTAVHNRAPHRATDRKVGSPDFWPSFCRLVTNKILTCNVLATAFCAVALLNFMAHEDIILESRFHVPRPTGMLLGFNDPLPSRLITTIVKPILIGLVVIISGLILAKARPRARYIVGYNALIVLLTIAIIVLLIFATCDKPPIVGVDGGYVDLLKYCNKNCRCSKDSDFRPVCESLGTYTYYSPCHAGCTSIVHVDNVKIYSGCSCVEKMTGWGNDQAKDGPCNSTGCQAGWMLFEFGSLLAYTLVASTVIGDLLINIRSVYKQDKAIGIGFWMTWLAIFVNFPGKIFYQLVSYKTCQYWGSQETICHLHDGETLGHYMCYLTLLFLSLSLAFKFLVWLFCKNLRLYEEAENKSEESVEIRELIEQPTKTELTEIQPKNDDTVAQLAAIIEPETAASGGTTAVQMEEEKRPARKEEESNQTSAPLKYGPLGPGDRRTTSNPPADRDAAPATIRNPDTEDDSSSDESKKQSSPRVAYSPLELESDVESDLSGVEARSRKRISGGSYDRADEGRSADGSSPVKRHFPNPDHYIGGTERSGAVKGSSGYLDGSSKTSSFEFSRKGRESAKPRGDFNEVGIPIADPFPGGGRSGGASTTNLREDVKTLIDRYEQNASQETLSEDQLSVKSADDTRSRSESKIVSGIPLVAMVPGRSSSRGGQSSSGFGSLPDVHDKDTGSERRATASPQDSVKGSGRPTYRTDL